MKSKSSPTNTLLCKANHAPLSGHKQDSSRPSRPSVVHLCPGSLVVPDQNVNIGFRLRLSFWELRPGLFRALDQVVLAHDVDDDVLEGDVLVVPDGLVWSLGAVLRPLVHRAGYLHHVLLVHLQGKGVSTPCNTKRFCRLRSCMRSICRVYTEQPELEQRLALKPKTVAEN